MMMNFTKSIYGGIDHILPHVPRGWVEWNTEDRMVFFATGKMPTDTRSAGNTYVIKPA